MVAGCSPLGGAALGLVAYWKVSTVRYYVRDESDGLEPTAFDVCYDYQAETAKDLAARFYVKIERDPERAAHLEDRQNAAILEALQWINDHLAELGAHERPLPDSWPE
jgi:hypothetical protein